MEFIFPFDSVTLTDQVNLITNDYGMLNALNLFPAEPIATRVVGIQRVENQIRVLPQKPLATRGVEAKAPEEKIFWCEIPHFPHPDALGPLDIQGKFALVEGRAVPMSVDIATALKLRDIRRHHAITREYLRFAALKGLVKDGDGKTILDLYDFFGITKITVDLALGTSTTEVMDKLEEVHDAVHEGVQGDTVSRVEAVIGTGLLQRLIKHPKFDKYWLNTPEAQSLAKLERHNLGQDFGRIIDTGNVMLRESKAKLPVKTGMERLMDTDKGVAYPAGTTNMFVTYDGPVFHMDEVNKPGQEIFISEELLDHGKGVEFESQSNVLPIVKRPEALVEIISSN